MDLNGSAMPWPGVIRAYTNPGLSTCLEQRRLCSGGLPFPISRLEIEALRLAEWAFARGRALVLCPPDPLAPISELIAAAVHMGDMIAFRNQTGMELSSSRHVAVVTTDYHARAFYRDLGVRNPSSMSIAPLREVVPAATLGRDSVIRVLGADPRNGWSTLFVPTLSSLRSVTDVKIDLVVVNLPCRDIDGVLDLGVPVVIVANDPADRFISTIGDRAMVFAWDRLDLERIREDDGLPPRLARRINGGSCEVVAVQAHAVCENAALFWQDIVPLLRSGGRSSVARQLSQAAFSLFHDLSGLALPLKAYEDMSEPIRVRIDAVEAASRLTHGDTRDLYLPMVGAELRDLARALGSDPPKRDALVRTLLELVDDHDDVMLITRTAALARLHEADMRQFPRLADIRVTSFGALRDLKPADAAVLTGMAPAWARSVYRSGVATTLRVLAYTPEGTVESVAQGYDEVELVRRTVTAQLAAESWLARPSRKDQVWSALSGEPRRIPLEDETRPSEADIADVPVRTLTPPDVPPGLWDGEEWLAGLEQTTSDDGVAAEGAGLSRSGAVVVSAKRITFDDGRWTLVEADGTVTRVRPGTGDSDPSFAVASLKVGDRVLIFDGDSRKDLMAKVIEVMIEVPALAVAASWVAHWRGVLETAYRRFGSYGTFADRLRAEGCTVQDQTVRLWVIGDTIGPENDDDVYRVGLITEDAVLCDNHREVCRAIRSLRGAHVRLGQRLSEMARTVGSAAAAGLLQSDEVVDERTGLTVADIQESIDILIVHSIEEAGEVPYILVGNLNEAELQEEPSD